MYKGGCLRCQGRHSTLATLTWRWYHLYSAKKSLEGAVSTALYTAMLFSSPECQIPRCKLSMMKGVQSIHLNRHACAMVWGCEYLTCAVEAAHPCMPRRPLTTQQRQERSG